MSGTCVIGLQWGDEAKGKLVDWLTKENDIVVRASGSEDLFKDIPVEADEIEDLMNQ